MLDKTKIIAIGSDHGGYELKEFLMTKMTEAGYNLKDYGCSSTESVDYPDIIHPLAEAINNKEYEKGIIICGSGQGAQMTANKHKFVRAALCWDLEQTELTRRHNDANVLSLPGRFIDFKLAFEIVELFLNTDFEGGRHSIRVDKISNY
ncbi:MAG: ribose 5-phosphate isomerase B [Bacteroidota bacterium]